MNTPSVSSNIKPQPTKGYGGRTPITVDLFSSQDTTFMTKPQGRVLESGDNPISSISSKAGLMGFKAFQGDNIQKPKKMEEPIIIGVQDQPTNSSLADMFKTKKHNIINKLNTRDK